jgi:hypothetical protein
MYTKKIFSVCVATIIAASPPYLKRGGRHSERSEEPHETRGKQTETGSSLRSE